MLEDEIVETIMLGRDGREGQAYQDVNIQRGTRGGTEEKREDEEA